MNPEINQINKALEKELNLVLRRERLEKHIARLETQLKGMQMDLKALEKSVAKEEMDVIKLEKKSMSTLFFKVLGNIESQLEIERQEYLMEVLKYNELLDSIKLTEYEIKVLKKTFEEVKMKPSILQSLIKQKAGLLRAVDKKFSIKITLLDTEIDSLHKKGEQLIETKKDGKKALTLLDKIDKDLKQVKEWGVWKYYGAGNYSAYAKKNYIDRARKNAVKANLLLKNYEADLQVLFKDLDIPSQLRLDKFDIFLNMFYDNLITDWIVQKHIQSALQNIQITMDKVLRLQSTIESQQKQLKKDITQKKRVRQKLIVEA